MVIPDDFLAAVQKNVAAAKQFAKLNRRNLFTIYFRLVSAKREATRTKRIVDMVAWLARGEVFHP